MQTGYIEGGGRVTAAAGWFGSYRAAATTPLEPADIMAGHLLFIAFRLLSSSAAFVAVMAAFGVVAGWSVLAVLPAALLTGLAFAAPAAAWAVGQRSTGKIQTRVPLRADADVHVLRHVLRAQQLPHGVRLVASALPLTQGVALCRSLSLGTATALDVAARAGYLLAFVVGGHRDRARHLPAEAASRDRQPVGRSPRTAASSSETP